MPPVFIVDPDEPVVLGLPNNDWFVVEPVELCLANSVELKNLTMLKNSENTNLNTKDCS